MRPRSDRYITLLLLTGVAAFAHELDVAVQLSAPAAILRATYANSDPAPFAKIQVFTPAKQEFQAGNTDRRGYFSFIPEGPGEWHVIVDDEMGHRKDVAVTVPARFTGASSTAAANPDAGNRLERTLLGIALLIGATGFWYGFKSRSRT
jgi:nickel transport protein